MLPPITLLLLRAASAINNFNYMTIADVGQFLHLGTSPISTEEEFRRADLSRHVGLFYISEELFESRFEDSPPRCTSNVTSLPLGHSISISTTWL